MAFSFSGVMFPKIGNSRVVTIFKSRSAKFSITVTDSDGDSINLTDWEAKFQVRKTYSSATADIDIDATVEGGDGEVVIDIPATSTDSVGAGDYVYELVLIKELDKITLQQGVFTILPTVYR